MNPPESGNAATTPSVHRKLAREHARKRHYKKALEHIAKIETLDEASGIEAVKIAREALDV